MSLEFKSAKDHLVALLFELSKAAQDAAAAAVDFYRVAPALVLAQTLALAVAPGQSPAQVAQALAQVEVDPLLAHAGESAGAAESPQAASSKPAKKPRKKRADRDPNAPKKPLTIYFAYAYHTREQIRKERQENNLPPLIPGQLNELVKQRWQSIDASEKAFWQEKYADQLKHYKEEKEKYAGELASNGLANIDSFADLKSNDEKADSDSDEDAAHAQHLSFIDSVPAPSAAPTVSSPEHHIAVHATQHLEPAKLEKKREKKRKGEKKEKLERKKKDVAH